MIVDPVMLFNERECEPPHPCRHESVLSHCAFHCFIGVATYLFCFDGDYYGALRAYTGSNQQQSMEVRVAMSAAALGLLWKGVPETKTGVMHQMVQHWAM